jgi:hypothetical protein
MHWLVWFEDGKANELKASNVNSGDLETGGIVSVAVLSLQMRKSSYEGVK